ncbi:MAG: GTPase [Bacteroidota bacterium]
MELLFVYNAKSGLLDKLIDGAHKIVSPSTYDCNLCAITFGNFTEDELWKAFRQHSDIPMQFWYKDEFKQEFRSKWLPKFEFPIVLVAQDGNLEPLITTAALNKLTSAEELIEEIRKRLPHD